MKFKLQNLYYVTLIILIFFLNGCTPKTEISSDELRYFPSCFEGSLNGPRGDSYTNNIRVDLASHTVTLRIDSYSIPSFAELRSHCNIIKYSAESPRNGTNVKPGLLNMYSSYTPKLNEPHNPCRDNPMFTLIRHDWLGSDNQYDIYDNFWNTVYSPYVFLVYTIDNSETRTAWSNGSSTKGWDGIVKANFTHVLLENQGGSTIISEAVWDRSLTDGYINSIVAGYISETDLRAIANFSRVYHYLKTLKLFLQFYQPGPITGQPQVLKGDWSLEAKVSHDTYRTSNGWYNPKLFKASILQAHPTYGGPYSENGWNTYAEDYTIQVPSIRGTTNGLTVCSH